MHCGEFLVVIDFVHNLPIFAVSIGLQKHDETIIGVVHNPAADKCFWGIKNEMYFIDSWLAPH